jgi:hypothetical protein
VVVVVVVVVVVGGGGGGGAGVVVVVVVVVAAGVAATTCRLETALLYTEPLVAPPRKTKKRAFRISPIVALAGSATADAVNVAVAPAGKLAIWQFVSKAFG